MTARIVYISIFQKGYGGGEGQVAHEMARYFASYNEVALICPGPKNEYYREPEGLHVFTVESAGEDNLVVPLLSSQNVNRVFEFLDTFNPQVIHAHDPVLLGVVGQLWARMHNVAFVYTAHVIPGRILEFGASELIKVPVGSLADNFVRDYLLNFYENCDTVICLNQIIKNEIRKFGYEGRTDIIPNGRLLQLYTNCKIADASRPDKDLVFIGFLTQRKNQQYLLQVMEHLPVHYHLYLVGEGLDAEYTRQLQIYADENCADKVTFTGKVEHHLVPQYLERSHLLVSASKMEVQSLVIIEALASGTPVVGLSNETVDELVNEAVGAALPREADPAEFALAVERVCTLPENEYQKRCQQARIRVRHLDWSNIMLMTLDAYRSIPPRLHSESSQRQAAILFQVTSRLPDGIVKKFLDERIRTLIKPTRRKGMVPMTTLWFVRMTRTASVIAFPILKTITFFRHLKS